MKIKFLPMIEKKFQKPTENLFGETIHYFDEEKDRNNDGNESRESEGIKCYPNKSSERDNNNHNNNNDNDNNDNNNNDNNNNDNNDNYDNNNKIQNNNKYKKNDNKEIDFDPTPVLKINIPIPKGGMINWRDLISSSAVKVIKKEEVEEVEVTKNVYVESVSGIDTHSVGESDSMSESLIAVLGPVVDRSTIVPKSVTVASPLRSSQPIEPTVGHNVAAKKICKSDSDSISSYDNKGCSSGPKIKVVSQEHMDCVSTFVQFSRKVQELLSISLHSVSLHFIFIRNIILSYFFFFFHFSFSLFG